MSDKNGAMKVSIEKGILIIRIPVEKKLKPSASGKTLRVASSLGNKETEAKIDGESVIVGLNAYIRANK